MIQPIEHVAPVKMLPATNAVPPSGDAFALALQTAIQTVEAQGRHSSQLAEEFLAGGPVDLHSVALSAQKAALQFDYFLQVRNKVVHAYQEVMRMQL
jgi:flagellar hook-basal body complex protein FliE